MPDLFSALADPTRLAIVERLLTDGECAAGDLGNVADISAPAISRHLRALRGAGVIGQRVAGTRRFSSVEPRAKQSSVAWTMDHRTFWEGSLDRLARAFSSIGVED